LENNANAALAALQLGCATKILEKEQGERFSAFRANGTDLPIDVRHGDGAVPRVFGCAKRLGKWFGEERIHGLKQLLRIEF
jgi:hypothetical protein